MEGGVGAAGCVGREREEAERVTRAVAQLGGEGAVRREQVAGDDQPPSSCMVVSTEKAASKCSTSSSF